MEGVNENIIHVAKSFPFCSIHEYSFALKNDFFTQGNACP